MLKINGKEVKNNGAYAFDNCHKFYILENDNEKFKALEFGYEIYPIQHLVTDLKNSCPLRFINSFNLENTYLLQGEESVEIEINGKLTRVNFERTL